MGHKNKATVPGFHRNVLWIKQQSLNARFHFHKISHGQQKLNIKSVQFCNLNEHSYINLSKVVDHRATAEISVSFVLTSGSKIILLYSPNLMMFKDLNLSFHSVPYASGHVHPCSFQELNPYFCGFI